MMLITQPTPQIIVFERPKLIRALHDGILRAPARIIQTPRGRQIRYGDELIPWRDVPGEWLPLLPWYFTSYIQSKSADAGSVTTTNLTFTSNITAGSTIVLGARIGATSRVITVTDDRSNAYTNITPQEDATGTAAIMSYAQNCAAGATQVTIAISGAAASIRFAIGEYGGLAAASFDQTAGNKGGPSNAPSSGNTPNTTQAIETLVAFISNSDDSTSATLSQGSGFTSREKVNVGGTDKCMLEDQEVSSIGAYAGTGVLSNALNQWEALIITLKAASTGGNADGQRVGGSRTRSRRTASERIAA